jgi:LysR family carnitine catabolism transcriptional activator
MSKLVDIDSLFNSRHFKPIQSDHLIYSDTSHGRKLGYDLRVSMSSLREVIRLTNGVSLLTALTAADLSVHGDLVARPFDSAQWFNFYLVHQHAMKDNRAVSDVLEIAKNCARQTSQETESAAAFVIH